MVSLAVESPPPPKEKKQPASVRAAVPLGRGMPMGRGITAPVPGLAGPAPGVGRGMPPVAPPPGYGRGMPAPPGFTPGQ